MSGIKKLFPLLLIFSFFFISCHHIMEKSEKGPVSQGVVDLRGYSFSGDELIQLSGGWGFFWNTFLTQDNFDTFVQADPDFYIPIPGVWNSVEEHPTPTNGTAVYAITILVDEDAPLLGLQLYNNNPNYTIYSNGIHLFTSGQPSADKNLSLQGNNAIVLPLWDEAGVIHLVLTQSNWSHTSKPGFIRTPRIGRYESAMKKMMQRKIRESLYFGGMFLLALYLLFIFIFNKGEKGYFWLALIILLAAIYGSIKGPLVLIDLFPSISGEVRHKILYLIFLIYPSLALKQYGFQNRISFLNRLSNIDGYVVFFLSLVIIFSHQLYSKIEIFYIIHLLGITSYILAVLVRNIILHKTLESVLYLTSYLMLFVAVAFSLLDNYSHLLYSGLMGIFFLFCLFQTALEARYASKNLLLVQVLRERNKALRDQKDQYENQALMDHLTRVKNRRSMDNYLQKSWDMCFFLKQGLGVIMVDIDYFKKFNDSLGHREGDRCLVKVAEALSESLKRNQDFIARYGGEEFIIIIQGVDSLDALLTVGESLRKSVEKIGITHPDSDCSSVVTISVGVDYMVPRPESSSDELVHRADTSLYLAKNRGRNRVETINTTSLEKIET